MVNASLKALFSQVSASTDAKVSALVLLNGLVQRMQAAIDFAVAHGVRKTDLDSVQDEVDIWRVSTDRFAEAIVVNTPDTRFVAVRPYPKTAAEKRFEDAKVGPFPAHEAEWEQFPALKTPAEARASDKLIETERIAAEKKAKAEADEARRVAGLKTHTVYTKKA